MVVSGCKKHLFLLLLQQSLAAHNTIIYACRETTLTVAALGGGDVRGGVGVVGVEVGRVQHNACKLSEMDKKMS